MHSRTSYSALRYTTDYNLHIVKYQPITVYTAM